MIHSAHLAGPREPASEGGPPGVLNLFNSLHALKVVAHGIC